jgi:hypothetical protein
LASDLAGVGLLIAIGMVELDIFDLVYVAVRMGVVKKDYKYRILVVAC